MQSACDVTLCDGVGYGGRHGDLAAPQARHLRHALPRLGAHRIAEGQQLLTEEAGAYSPCSSQDAFYSFMAGAGIGALAGGVVGGLVGSLIPQWKLRYASYQ